MRRALIALALCLSLQTIADDEIARAARLSDGGDYTGALASLADAVADPDPLRSARARHARAKVHLAHGNVEDAARDLEWVIATLDRPEQFAVAAESLLLRARMRAQGGNAEAAEALLERVERGVAEGGDPALLQQIALVRARGLLFEGDFESAARRLTEIRAFFAAADDRERLRETLTLEAYALENAADYEAARESYHSLIEIAFELDDQRSLTYAYCNLGSVEQALGRPAAAGEHLDRAIEQLDRLRELIPSDTELRRRYLDAQISAYDHKIAMLVDEGEIEEAFRLSERFHGRFMFEQLARRPEPAELGSEEREALDRLIALQRELVAGRLPREEEPSLRAAEKEWERALRARLLRRGGAPAGDEAAVDLDALVRALPDSTALLAYWVHPERTFVWLVRRDGIELAQIPTGRRELREALDAYLAPIVSRTRAEDLELRGGAAAHLAQGHALHRRLLGPLRERLRAFEHLIVVPHGELWRLPFEALVERPPAAASEDGVIFSTYAAARYAAESHTFVYAHSSGVWQRLSSRRSAERGLVAVAPTLDGSNAARERGWELAPLPGAREEARAIAAMFEDGRRLIGEAATERDVARTIAGKRFVHFAAHGYDHTERPRLSGLFLWPETQSVDDGLLQAYEVGGLELDAELVSLAVCGSGGGQLSPGEGLVGLGRAFLAGGAQSALVALWPVDDGAGRRLMERFYRELREGPSVRAALRDARAALRAETTRATVVLGDETVSYAHPYFWAPYVVVGGERR